jgi:hypothetical protein
MIVIVEGKMERDVLLLNIIVFPSSVSMINEEKRVSFVQMRAVGVDLDVVEASGAAKQTTEK